MKNSTFHSQNTKALRQLRFLSTTLNQKVKSGQINQATLIRLKQSIVTIINRLKSRVRQTTIRKVMGPAFVLFGLMGSQSVQAQIFSDPIPLPEIPSEAILIPELVDLDGDGDLDITGLTYDYSIDSLVAPFIENIGAADALLIESLDLDTIQAIFPQVNFFGFSSGDVDNDGDVDFLGTVQDSDGVNGEFDVLFYENQGDLTFRSQDLSLIHI